MTEEQVVALLDVHYKAAGWAWSPRTYATPASQGMSAVGRWSCGCGAEGIVEKGETVTGLWRAHLARVLVAAGLGA